MPCPYVLALWLIGRMRCVYLFCVCFICFVGGNKMGVFALRNMGVVDFVVWIFFCKFVDCVWWIVCGG